MHRLQQGLKLLESEQPTTRPIAEIAQQAGYADPAYFSREVKRHTGQSPQQWRKQRGIN